MTPLLSPELLSTSARRASRVVARARLQEIANAAARLHAEGDESALHDFRVAVRRLRSWLRAYHDSLRDTVRHRTRRRLADLAAATNDPRDAEVAFQWVHGQERLAAADRAGADYLHGLIRTDKDDAEEHCRRRIAKLLPKTMKQLGEQLAHYRLDVRLDFPGDDPCMAAVSASLVRAHAEALSVALAAVHSADDAAEAHRARIAGKRLRYLLEPLAEQYGAEEIVARLKELQDAVGDFRDAQLLVDRIQSEIEDLSRPDGDETGTTAAAGLREGLGTLAGRAREQAAGAFARFTREWLGDGSSEMMLGVAALADSVERAAAPSTPMEYERKYLLSRLPRGAASAPSQVIRQGYLPGSVLIERIRHVKDGEENRYYRTVKVGRGVARTELEEETTRELFMAMWPHTAGCRVKKRRYRVDDGAGRVWEIDRFLDRRLVLAEIELPSADTEVTIPPWLRGVLVRDVTDESEFVNRNLAK